MNITEESIPERVRELFKGRSVLLIGDSIVRGIYKDLACILSGHDRLLYSTELKFNRHRAKNEAMFGEHLEDFHINRTNSIYNIERRTLQNVKSNYYLTYVFSSRIWNHSMEKMMLSIKNYDVIFIGSQIWDLTRYGNDGHELYLQNLHNCFSRLKSTKKNIVWITTPPVDDNKHTSLNEFLVKTTPFTITKAHEYGFDIVDLNGNLKNYVDLRATDGVHWKSEGQRLMTQYVADYMSKLSKQNSLDVIDPVPSVSHINNNETLSLGEFNFLNGTPYQSVRLHGIGNGKPREHHNRIRTFPNRFTNYHTNHNTFHCETKGYARSGYRKEKKEDEKFCKRLKLSKEEAEHFGVAFGTAWKAAN